VRPIATAALVVTLAATARAETPAQLPVQGYLVDEALSEPVEGEHPVRFRLYAEAVGGDALWEETQPVEFVGGWFGASLGAVTPLSPGLFERAAPLYLGVLVEDDDAELSPRSPLGGAPYALHAATAGGVSDLDGLVESLTGRPAYREALTGPAGADGQQGPEGPQGVPGGPVHNLGLTYDEETGTLAITQANGEPFDAAMGGTGRITMGAVTRGLKVTLVVSEDTHRFTDGRGESDIAGWPFGTTPGVAWPTPRPFFPVRREPGRHRRGAGVCRVAEAHVEGDPGGRLPGEPWEAGGDALRRRLVPSDREIGEARSCRSAGPDPTSCEPRRRAAECAPGPSPPDRASGPSPIFLSDGSRRPGRVPRQAGPAHRLDPDGEVGRG